MINKTCKFCGKTFLARSNNRKYCSKKCTDLDKKGKKPWNKGVPMRTESKKKLQKQKIELVCLHCGKKFLVYPSDANKRKYCSKECSYHCREYTPFSDEHREKLSISGRKRVIREKKERYGISQLMPNFNSNACDFFDYFNKVNNTNGRHAMNGGERRLGKIIRYPDYFNEELKVMIECYEKHHYSNNKIIEADIKRENEIKKYYSDYSFIIFNEEEMNDYYKLNNRILSIINN